MFSFVKISLVSSILFFSFTCFIQAARDYNFTVTHKYANTTEGYFNTPHLIKARAYWEDKKTIDSYEASSISLEAQVGYAAGSQTADVFTPSNLSPDKPVGIYIHINHSDGADLPSNLDAILQKHYLIGASPDNAGNNRHDPERTAHVLDLVATLKAQYNIDNARVYVGGLSGGALEAMLCGMLYPDTFTGVISTEHVMNRSYWKKIFTLEEMYEMANRGQRWSIILGKNSYAFDNLAGVATSWKYHLTYDHGESPIRFTYKPFFDTYTVWVPGMGHWNPAPAVFEKSLIFVDARAMLPRVRTYSDWEGYAFRPDNPETIALSHNIDEPRPVAGDPSINHLPGDNFDGDDFNNWHEYLANSDPTIPNDTPPLLSVSGKACTLHYRGNAQYHELRMHTSGNLISWDTSGNGAQVTSTDEVPGQAMVSVHFEPTGAALNRLFYKPVITHTAPQNLTQLAGVTASQFTTGWGGLAGYGIDGNRDANFDNNSTTHTDTSSQNWWQVDLVSERQIHSIVLFNRSDHQDRLSNFRVSVLNASDVEVIGKNFYVTTGNVGTSEAWSLPDGILGHKVKISMLGNNRQGNTILSLAEVEVLGY